jgi:DNA repair exonuclease SbcCD ATPase subunit
VSGLSDRLTNVDKLKAEIKRLEQLLQSAEREKEALERELSRLWQWTEIVGPAFEALHDVVRDLRDTVERTSCKTMADLETLAGQVQGLRGDAAAEAQEVKSKLDEMTALIQQLQQNQNDPARIQAISDELTGLQGEIRAIFTGEAPPPGSRRR